MRLPFPSFVNNLLISINQAPGQLVPISGWLNITIFEVASRMCIIKPTFSLFSALFTSSHTPFQTTFTTRRKRNILVGPCPNKMLQDEAKSLPTYIAADIEAVVRIQSILPQGVNKLPWYAFNDEAMLVKTCLVYDKEFNFEVGEEITSYIARETTPVDVNFDEMLSKRPSLFTRVAITTKPREFMAPESAPAIPLAATPAISPTTIPAAKIPSTLKRLAKEILASTS
ncbi:hypothetical protein LIER_30807 [Lithospermum erythrorhizon]|uniref:Uncharacterized protein n=1 Tax=Lithospermum erythrorhizon TaxID=34254 RepID=A0AAV3RNY9_LITER